MGAIERIILQDSGRGMDRLAPYLPADWCLSAAREMLLWKRGNVLLTTGFIIDGCPETDGPVGTLVLARALSALGFGVVLLAEESCCKVMEPFGLTCVPVSLDATVADLQHIVDVVKPVGAVSIERCGRNADDDYLTMSGKSVRRNTAPIDRLFDLLAGKVPRVAIGDGGNEIGMGNMVAQIVAEKLPISPCVVTTDILAIATVSNWAAYGIVAYLEILTGAKLLPAGAEVFALLRRLVAAGCIDGVSHRPEATVDGFELGREGQVVDQLATAIRAMKSAAASGARCYLSAS